MTETALRQLHRRGIKRDETREWYKERSVSAVIFIQQLVREHFNDVNKR